MLSAQIETRLGSGEGSSAKGPDMKVWSRGKGLENVGHQFLGAHFRLTFIQGGLVLSRVLLPSNYHIQVIEVWLRPEIYSGVFRR